MGAVTANSTVNRRGRPALDFTLNESSRDLMQMPSLACLARLTRALIAALACPIVLVAQSPAPTPSGCNQPAADAVIRVDLPGSPFQAAPTEDGCWIFVSLNGADTTRVTGIVVLTAPR